MITKTTNSLKKELYRCGLFCILAQINTGHPACHHAMIAPGEADRTKISVLISVWSSAHSGSGPAEDGTPNKFRIRTKIICNSEHWEKPACACRSSASVPGSSAVNGDATSPNP